jgi:hypothetical protein
MPAHESVEALKNMISEVETLIATTAPLPENRSARCLELLRAALALADDIPAIDGGLFERANHAQLYSHHVEEGRERYSPARFVSVAKDASPVCRTWIVLTRRTSSGRTDRCASGASG